MASSSQGKGGIKADWGKHLRPFGKRQHWKRVRHYSEPEKPSQGRRGKTKHKPWIIKTCFSFFGEFIYTKRYATERDMRNALRSMKHRKEDIVYYGHRSRYSISEKK